MNSPEFCPGYLDNFKAMMHGNNNSVEVDYMTPLNSSNYYESIILTIKGIDINRENSNHFYDN